MSFDLPYSPIGGNVYYEYHSNMPNKLNKNTPKMIKNQTK